MVLCFNYSTSAARFNTARAACQAQGGELVKYDSADKQLRVETFFGKKFSSLSKLMYWQGISRAARAEELKWTADDTPVPGLPSNDPYAHWWVRAAGL
jgi:hypothetical protein